MSRARTPELPLSLEQRLAADLMMTGGQLRIVVIVADEKERAQALRFLLGRKNARLLTLVTTAESEARRAERLRRVGAG